MLKQIYKCLSFSQVNKYINSRQSTVKEKCSAFGLRC